MVIQITLICDRVIIVTFDSTMPITIINVYAPPSTRTAEENGSFYKTLQDTYGAHHTQEPTYIRGDFIARVQKANG